MEKKRLILSGCRGRLGGAIAAAARESGAWEIVCGVDVADGDGPFPVVRSFSEIRSDADVVVDASHHSVTAELIEFALSRGLPTVICTTGHTEGELALISSAAEKIPILKSRNMSVGISVLLDLVRRAAAALGEGYDAEIVEAHHGKKLDAPSGTALMLADAVRSVRPDAEYVYDRHDVRRERGRDEIGIHSIRGGTIVGEHSVIFAGHDEVITISHSAGSRELFATGALRAASFLPGREPGLYSLSDAIN